MSQPAVFLDRDGTLNVDVGYPHRPEDLQLIEHVPEGLRRIAALGFALVIVTNQSGVARGYFSEAQMHAFNAALVARLADEGVPIAGVYCCPFYPEATVAEYRLDSPLRKPRPGMILRAAAEHDLDLGRSFVIGDKLSDISAGKLAGCRTILLATGKAGRGEPQLTVRPDAVADHMLRAAEVIRSALVQIDLPGLAETAYAAAHQPPTASVRMHG